MNQKDVKFDNPPVVETVLGLQFNPIAGFTSAHAGHFWKKELGQEWTSIAEVTPISDQFELFGDKKIFKIPQLLIQQATPLNRIQITSRDQDRMIQIQNTRFIYNWRKQKDGVYPSFKNLFPEFTEKNKLFENFVVGQKLPKPSYNQWEMTYVNHFRKEQSLWQSPKDWSSIFPGLFSSILIQPQLESFGGEWSFLPNELAGRIHVKLNHARLGAQDGPEAIVLTLTARGPISSSTSEPTVTDIFTKANKALEQLFVEITNKDLQHLLWKRQYE